MARPTDGPSGDWRVVAGDVRPVHPAVLLHPVIDGLSTQPMTAADLGDAGPNLMLLPNGAGFLWVLRREPSFPHWASLSNSGALMMASQAFRGGGQITYCLHDNDERRHSYWLG
jgi:hypothetical protein